MPKRALLICNGEAPGASLARRLARKSDLVVAADGGANIARNLGIIPDVIIGDLDSIAAATRRYFSDTRLVRVSRQDNTDLEKALDFLVSERVTHAVILAATGKRLDFTLGNLSVLWNYVTDVDLISAGDGWTAIPIVKKKTLTVRKGTTVSLIPFGDCSGITLRGLKYPLTNAKMQVGEIGVSNVVSKQKFTIDVNKGKMLLIVFDEANNISGLS